jgi:hypothetical protein
MLIPSTETIFFGNSGHRRASYWHSIMCYWTKLSTSSLFTQLDRNIRGTVMGKSCFSSYTPKALVCTTSDINTSVRSDYLYLLIFHTQKYWSTLIVILSAHDFSQLFEIFGNFGKNVLSVLNQFSMTKKKCRSLSMQLHNDKCVQLGSSPSREWRWIIVGFHDT